MNFNIIKRYFIFILGLLFMGLGIALTVKSNLGNTPISSVPYVLSLIFPISFGLTTLMLSMIFLLIEIILLRRDFPRQQYLQVLVPPFFGSFVDLGMFCFASVDPHIYFENVIVLLIACAILALGIYLQVVADVLINPGEGVVKIIAEKTGQKFGNIKIMFDCTLALIAITISLYHFGTIKALREGTIVSALLVGYITKIYDAIYKHFRGDKTLYQQEAKSREAM
jgi:uncharacterized membrane protein YczE